MIQKVKHVTVFCFALILASATWHTGAFLVEQGLRVWSGAAAKEYAEFQESCKQAAIHEMVKRAIGPEAYAAAGGIVISVEDTGVVGNGVVDDGPAIQVAVDRAEVRGGVVWLPENLIYGIGAAGVVAESFYPVSIVSAMPAPNIQGASDTDPTHIGTGFIKPLANNTVGLFKWVRPGGAGQFDIGGAIASGLVFIDPSGSTADAPGSFEVHSAINFTDNFLGGVRNCYFFRLNGRAIYLDNAQIHCDELHMRWCGDTSKSPIHLDTANSFAWIDRLQMESCYDAPYIQVDASAGLELRQSSFEADTNVAAQSQKFLDGAGSKHVRGCQFGRNDGTSCDFESTGTGATGDELSDSIFDAGSNTDLTAPFITWASNWGSIDNVIITSAPNQVAYAINITGANNHISSLRVISAGCVRVAGAMNLLSTVQVYAPVTTELAAFLIAAGGEKTQLNNCLVYTTAGSTGGVLITADNCTISGCRFDTIASHGINSQGSTNTIVGNSLVAITGTPIIANAGECVWANHGDTAPRHTIEIPLTAFREVDANGDVGNLAAHGGQLASDSTPILRGAATTENFEITWAAGNADPIQASVTLPIGFRGTTNVLVDLIAYTDNAGGGGIDPATFTVDTTFNNGTIIVDTADDTATAAITAHTVTATVAAGDITDTTAATSLTIKLTPAAHAADPTQLLGVRVRFHRLFVD